MPTPASCPSGCPPGVPGGRRPPVGSRGAATSRRVCPQAERRAGEEPRPLQPRRARPRPSPHGATQPAAPPLTCLLGCPGSDAPYGPRDQEPTRPRAAHDDYAACLFKYGSLSRRQCAGAVTDWRLWTPPPPVATCVAVLFRSGIFELSIYWVRVAAWGAAGLNFLEFLRFLDIEGSN